MKMMSARVVALVCAVSMAWACSSETGNTAIGGKGTDTVGSVADTSSGDVSSTEPLDAVTVTDADDASATDAGGADVPTATDVSGADVPTATDAGSADVPTATDATADAGDATTDSGGGKPSPTSCSGRCGQYDGDASCQCDSQCEQFGDCCADFKPQCGCTVEADCKKASNKCVALTCAKGVCSDPNGDTGINGAGKCNDDNPCTTDSCDLTTGKCTNVDAQTGTLCAADTCKTAMTCTSGKCGGGVVKKEGDSCSDGNACTLADKCASGTCAPGDAKTCDDKNSCTKDSCDPKKSCVYTPDGAEGAKCDDGNACSVDTKCTKTGACTGTLVAAGTKCDDGSLCTSDDSCSAFGSCYGASKSCNDNKPCTTDACDAKTGTCSNVVKSDGSYCSDGNTCTTSDKCLAGACQGTEQKDGASCSDSNTCTTGDACTAGICDGVPAAAKQGKGCTDGDPCTTGDKCDNAGACLGEADATLCDDGDPCTTNVCQKVSTYSKKCDAKPLADNAACDDGDLCTSGSTCMKASCEGGKSVCKGLFSDSVDCGSGKWTFAPQVSASQIGWNVDATPSTPAAKSGTCSLNYNNGKDYDKKDASGASTSTKGTATSGAIGLPAGVTSVLSFWSYHGVEASTGFDNRTVVVSSDDFVVNGDSVSWTLNNKLKQKVWSKLSYSLAAFAGKKVKVRFDFDSKDTLSNSTPGWFVDDVTVQQKN